MVDSLARIRSSIGDRYQVERELGRGGMATVYLAQDRRHGRLVAVKVLLPDLAHAIGPARFLREIEIAARLSHPNILPLHDSGNADGLLYYVMPYVEGATLRDRLSRERTLALPEAVEIARHVADALTYAHGRGVVHRDIKPENIMLTGGQSVVADFGIAHAIDAAGSTRLTETGLVMGTPAYMSPEQASGARDTDGRSDIYSLGCLVYEMLAGEPPFSGPTAQAVMARHAIDPVPRLRTIRPSVPEGVERAVERALAKVPSDRFPTAEQFTTRLAQASTAEAIAAEARRARSGGLRRILIGSVGALALAGAAWWASTVLGGPSTRRLVVLPLANLTNEPAQEYFVQGMHDALISELAQAGVPVIARTSVMQYRSTTKSVRDIARELRSDAVVEASVARSEDSVHVRAQLVDGDTEETLWAGSYAGDLRNVLALHRQIARAIVGELRLPTAETASRPRSPEPVNPEAYEAYLKGMFHWRRQTAVDLDAAQRYFEFALEKDPGYALGHAGVAMVWSARQQHGFVPAGQATPLAKAAAEKALAQDSTLADVHLTLAGLRTWGDWDWEGAEAAFRQAIAINPNEPNARAYYSHYLHIVGRPEEAMEQIDRALALDPLNSLFQGLYAMDLMYARRFDDAIELLQTALRTEPTNPVALATLRSAYHEKGMYREALDVWRRSLAARNDTEGQAALDQGFAESGYAGALSRLAEMMVRRSRTSHVTPWQIGTLLTRAGKHDQALDWLEKAYEARDPNVPYLSVDPIFDDLRDHPRFRGLTHKLKLER